MEGKKGRTEGERRVERRWKEKVNREGGKKRGAKTQAALSLLDVMLKGHFLLEPCLVFGSELQDSLFLCNDPYAGKWTRAQAQEPIEQSQDTQVGKEEGRLGEALMGPGHCSQIGTRVPCGHAESAGVSWSHSQ